MLSRVAERLFWSARYLERVENIARLVSVYDEVLFDLPRDVKVSWYNLIEINGCVEEFGAIYKDQGEKNVMRFLLAKEDNPGSLLSSLLMVKENIRTTRDVVPEEMWELINELCQYAKNNIQQGINRSNRHAYLNAIIESCQKINGLLADTMSRDESWSFNVMGRYTERADMCTRILDSAVIISVNALPEEKVVLDQAIWSKVLKSQSGYLTCQRTMKTGIDSVVACQFLLGDQNFPRSLRFCLRQIKTASTYLPRYEAVAESAEALRAKTYEVESEDDINLSLSEYLNDIQLALIDLQCQIRETWFDFKHGEAA
ncbi:hypothetical protein GCE9029_03316 [Grimontia celer]|uniref:DUF403 domain-containing protein n=1 Tax=Grimontia celer TaxID=1796497 RepID=A0A128F719_9GAMM|nr:alpha-E domain-containing protein [Grimontia celer]CZF82587.1 hypothetical protein GCE9029_03316 [Grimontia celer]